MVLLCIRECESPLELLASTHEHYEMPALLAQVAYLSVPPDFNLAIERILEVYPLVSEHGIEVVA